MKTKHYIWLALGLLLVGVVVYIAFAGDKVPKVPGLPGKGGSGSAKPKDCGFPLNYGNTTPCREVKNLQKAVNQALRAIKYDTIEEDGLWGPATQAAFDLMGWDGLSGDIITQTTYDEFLQYMD